MGGTFYKIISNMYSHSKCCVKDNYNRSEFFNYDKGVRQGCILSPLLFNLYLNELPYILNNNAKDPILLPDGSHLNCLLYADDLLLISHSAESLQQSLDRLSKNTVRIGFLRAPDQKYRESHDRKEISSSILFYQKYPFGKLFSKIIFKSSSAFCFFQNLNKFEIRLEARLRPPEIRENRAFLASSYATMEIVPVLPFGS